MATSSSMSVGPGRLGRPLPDQGLGCRHPGLRLAATGLGTTPQPGQFAPGEVPPPVLGRRGLLLTLGPGLEVGGVAALMEEVGAPVELEHAGGDPVEEVAVVGDDDQAARVGGQPVLEPGHRGEVEVVGRLVEDQQLAGGGQDPGQRHPFGLAAGEFGHVGGRRGRPCPSRSSAAAASHPDPTASPTVPGGSSGVWSRNPVRTPRPWRTIPASGSSRPARTRQERRLAGPVDADDAEPVAGVDGHGQVAEQRAVGHGDAHALEIDEHAHRSYGTAGRWMPLPATASRRDADRSGVVTHPPAADRKSWNVTLSERARDDEECRCSDC